MSHSIPVILYARFKNYCRGQSQDGGVGGCGVHISSQLGHLSDTGGEPQHPRGQEKSPSDLVGYSEEGRGKRSGGRMGLAPLRDGWGRGRLPTPGEVH